MDRALLVRFTRPTAEHTFRCVHGTFHGFDNAQDEDLGQRNLREVSPLDPRLESTQPARSGVMTWDTYVGDVLISRARSIDDTRLVDPSSACSARMARSGFRCMVNCIVP